MREGRGGEYGVRIKYRGGRQERSPEGQENEWKYAASRDRGNHLERTRDPRGKRLSRLNEGILRQNAQHRGQGRDSRETQSPVKGHCYKI